MKKDRYIITAALPYANGPIHIGHLSGVYIPADIFSRYLRRNNKDVIFICGSDEHGAPITIKAFKEKVSPIEIVDKYHFMIKKDLKMFNISLNHYSRTSSITHHKISSSFFKNLNDKSFFDEKISEQYYDKSTNKFLADRYILGSCPNCNNNNAYGDQCEKCGITLSPDELINPKSIFSGNSPTKKKTKHLYIPLNKYQDYLNKWINNEKKLLWKKNTLTQVKAWITKGLKSRAITRDLSWGIPIPIKEYSDKVLYVWFEAPIGYISSTIEFCNKKNINWKLYWEDKNTKLIQFIGKDNIVFHCIIFPIMLKNHGKYILPYNTIANEFLNLENNKISTSKNWAVWLNDFIKDFSNQQDSLRYVLTVNMPENKDNNFTWKDFQIKVNSELISILGNFIHRVLKLTEKYFKNIVPNIKNLNQDDEKIIFLIKKFPKKIGKLIEKYSFREAINTFMKLPRIGNKYLTDKSPWKDNIENIKITIYVSLQIVGMIAQISEIFLPNTSKKLCNILNIPLYNWVLLHEIIIIPSGHTISNNFILFKKIENIDIDKQIKKLKKKN